MAKKKVAIYVGKSIIYPISQERQIEFLKSEIENIGHELVGVYIDTDDITLKNKTTKFNEMIKDAREGKIDGICCASLTALSVYPLDCKMIINEAFSAKNKHDFWFNFFLEGVNTSNEDWETMFNFKMLITDENIHTCKNISKMSAADGEELIGIISKGIQTKLNIVKDSPLHRLRRLDV